ncbi:MAG: histidine--tRNA ligase [Saprospiraceae bacterium]|nr:MAG: histidine--tRNA ligase [Saprospiraceae bacterium]
MKMERGIIPRKIKGFRDIDASLNELRQHIIRSASAVYRKYGFEHWDTPVLEYADALGKYMPDEDTVDQGVYNFRNPEEEPVAGTDGNELRDADAKAIMEHHALALRYDLTAPLARVYAERLWQDVKRKQIMETNAPLFRRFQYGPVYRYELKLMPGRFREFWQLDFDTVGTNDVAADAEACIILAEAMEAIGLNRGTYVVKVNNRKVLKGFLASIGVTGDQEEQGVLRVIDKLDKIGWSDVEAELGTGRTDSSGAAVPGMNLHAEAIGRIMRFLRSATGVSSRKSVLGELETAVAGNNLGMEGIAELKNMDALWAALGFDETRIIFDPTLMRGMAYYTGPVFEVESLLTFKDEKGKERKVGSICGGGRYDGLVEKLLGLKVPATGASIGVDRLAELLRMVDPAGVTAKGPVMIAFFDDDLQTQYYRIAAELRQAGIDVEVYCGFFKGFRKMNKQMAYADAKNCPAVILLGADEAAKGVATVKNLKLGKELALTTFDKKEWNAQVQKEVPLGNLVEYILGLPGMK